MSTKSGQLHFQFDDRGVTHRFRVLATPKLRRETEANRRLYSGLATEAYDGAAVHRHDDVNTANISVLDHHGDLLTLWGGGSPRAPMSTRCRAWA